MKNQTENNVFHCKNCGGVYDPAALSECPFCGVPTEEAQAAPAAAADTVADYAGGFGQPGSTISRVATAIAIALLLLSVGTLIYLGGTILTRGGDILKPDTSAAPEASTSAEQEPEPEEIPLTIKLDTDTITLAEGESYPFGVTLNPADWEGELVWTSDNEEIAAVVDGVVTNVNGGDCTITVTADTATATCKVHCQGVTLEEKKAAEEQAKREKEEAERKKAEEKKKKEEEEKKRKEEEKKRKEEEERRKAEEEAAAAQQASGGLTLTLYGNTYDDNDFTLVHVGEAYDFVVSGGSGTYSAVSSDSGVASVSGTHVTATGVGVANITWSDGSKSVTATIRVSGY